MPISHIIYPSRFGGGLILDGITGAISEWDGEDSAKTGSNPVTQWNDLITTNHFTENHTTGTGAVLTTINGRGALDFTPHQHYTSGITMPAPSTGFTMGLVLRPHDVSANRIVLGRRAAGAATGGASIWVRSTPAFRMALSDGVSLVSKDTGTAAINTTAIVQGGYDGSVVKIKVDGATPVTQAHSLTSLGGETDFGVGAQNQVDTSFGLDGDVLFVYACTGLLSDADMATIASRLNARFSVF